MVVAFLLVLGQHLKKKLKKRNLEPNGVKAIFSSESQQKQSLRLTDGTNYKKSFYGTVSYMPALFGLIGAAEVIRYLSRIDKK
jgi:tRNA threonylcarbamoyladenosine dehydratase